MLMRWPRRYTFLDKPHRGKITRIPNIPQQYNQCEQQMQVGRVTASVKPKAENQNDEAHSAHSGTCIFFSPSNCRYPPILTLSQVAITLVYRYQPGTGAPIDAGSW